MVPDVIGGTEQWHLLVTGADPDDGQTTRHGFTIAAGVRDPTKDHRAVAALPEGQPQSVSATRISGGQPPLHAGRPPDPPGAPSVPDETLDATCAGTVVDDQQAAFRLQLVGAGPSVAVRGRVAGRYGRARPADDA